MITVKQYQGSDTLGILDDLWELCREVIYYSNEVDRTSLSQEDLAELEAIDRITIGYSVGLQEIGAATPEVLPKPEELRSFADSLQSHCYRSMTALIATINFQLGISSQPIVLLDSTREGG